MPGRFQSISRIAYVLGGAVLLLALTAAVQALNGTLDTALARPKVIGIMGLLLGAIGAGLGQLAYTAKVRSAE